MKPHLKAELSLDALNMAVSNRKPESAVIFHSDRGIQYACKQFRDKLSELDFAQSMSRKANSYDNAMVESFLASLKREACDKIFESREQVRKALFEWIEMFYNRQRIHSSLGYLTPTEFEDEFSAKLCVH